MDRYRGSSRLPRGGMAIRNPIGQYSTCLPGLAAMIGDEQCAILYVVGATYLSNPYRYKISPLLHRGVCCTHRAGNEVTTGEDKRKSDDSGQLVQYDSSFSPISFVDEYSFIEIIAKLFRKHIIIARFLKTYRWPRESGREEFRHLQGHPRGLTNIRLIRNVETEESERSLYRSLNRKYGGVEIAYNY